MTATDNETLAIERVATADGLTALAPGWDDLVRAMPRPTPFLLHAWVDEWWRHYGTGAELVVTVARRGDRLVGALPLFVRRAHGLRVARFLGGHHSELADVLLAEDEPVDTARRLADAAVATGFDVADLFGLPAHARLAQSVGPRRLQLVERVEAPVLDLSPGWEAVYNGKISSKTRYSHRRKRKRLAEQGALDVVLLRTWEELEPALEDAFRLHDLRWAGRPDGSGFTTPTGKAFHRAAIRRLADADIFRLIQLRLDGRPIAFHSYFAFCGTLYSDRLAFDGEYARSSPGMLNTLDMLEAAAAEGLTRVEFLGGTEDYKLAFADRFEPLHQGLGLARTPQGRLFVLGRTSEIALRRRLKQSEALHKLYYDRLGPVRKLLGRGGAADAAAPDADA